jgi:hypothetical protein
MIGLLNTDTDIITYIRSNLMNKKVMDIDINRSIPTNLKSLYIDWIRKPISNKKDKKYLFQAAIVDKYVKKKIPIVIFDRYMCISNKEYKWLNKYNVKFFEPALNNRIGYEYLPFPINLDIDKLLFMEEEEERKVVLGFDGNRKNDSFEKYIVSYIKKYDNTNIIYNDLNNLWNNVQWTIALDDNKNYDIGYLNPNIIEAMKQGCSVFIPNEHKYYIGMFNNVDNINDMYYFIKNYTHNMKIADIISTYDTIQKLYPEFLIENIVSKILNKLGG